MYPDPIVVAPVAAAMTAKELAVYAGLAGVALTGWNLYLQSKIGSLNALWKWKDEFIAQYNDERILLVEKFATKAELQNTLIRLETHLDDLRKAIDRLRDRIDENHARAVDKT